MGKNYMPEIAQMLGVEIGEEFEILLETGGALDVGPYKFTSKTILDRDGEEIDGFLVIDLLNGIGTIQKRPWRPRVGELFWTINGKGDAEQYHFTNDVRDLALLNMGNCFPSKEAAKDCKTGCDNCPFTYTKTGQTCINFQYDHPEKAVAIVEEWAKEHPVRTYKSVFLEKFPNARMADVIDICVETIFGNSVPECGDINCEECWKREVEEN